MPIEVVSPIRKPPSLSSMQHLMAGLVLLTPRGYMDAEACLGAWRQKRKADCEIVTKLAPLSAVRESKRAGAARDSLQASMTALRVQTLPLVLAHREDDLLSTSVRSVLDEAVGEGLIGAWGASVTSVDGAMRLIEHVPLAALQLPVNVADSRFTAVIAHALQARITVFARSLFLQGALLMETVQLPQYLAPLRRGIAVLNDVARQTGRSKSELCLLAVEDRPEIDSLVIGVEQLSQLAEHLSYQLMLICSIPV